MLEAKQYDIINESTKTLIRVNNLLNYIGENEMKWILLSLWIPIILSIIHVLYPLKVTSISSARAKLFSLWTAIFGFAIFIILWTS